MGNKKTDTGLFGHIRTFLTVYLPKNRCLSANTIKSYKDTINLLRGYLQSVLSVRLRDMTFDSINHSVVSGFLVWLQQSRGCGAATCNQRLAAIKSFLRYCSLEDPTLTSLYLEIDSIAPKKKPIEAGVKYLTKEALSAILSKPDTKDRRGRRDLFFMILAYDTGARVSELLYLKTTAIHLDTKVPYIHLTGKGNKTRGVPLMDKTVRHLLSYLRDFHTPPASEYLFYTRIKGTTGPMSDDNVSYFLRRYAKLAAETQPDVPLKLHAHIFRHSRATHMYQAGIPLSYIKDFLGHVSLDTTMVYASTDITMMREALEKVAECTTERNALNTSDDGERDLLELCGLL